MNPNVIPERLSKLWCDRCRDYTRHSRQLDGSVICRACGYQHVPPDANKPARASARVESSLSWRNPGFSRKENLDFVLAESRRIFNHIQQLNRFIEAQKLNMRHLPNEEVKAFVEELSKLLE
jgi:hypothetical protein